LQAGTLSRIHAEGGSKQGASGSGGGGE